MKYLENDVGLLHGDDDVLIGKAPELDHSRGD